MKKLIALLLAMTTVLGLSACSSAPKENPDQSQSTEQEVLELRAGHNSGVDAAVHVGLEELKRLVEEKSDGRIKITIYPNAQLGDVREMVEMVQTNSLDMMVGGSSQMTGFVKELGVFDLPYLINSTDEAKKVFTGEPSELLNEKLKEVNLNALCWWAVGIRNVTNSVRPIEKFEDLAGLRIRIQNSDVFNQMMQAWGCDPVPMSWTDAFTALQQGAVDGQENPLSIIYTNQVYEVNKYCAVTEHVFSPAPLLISNAALEKLSEEDKALLYECAAEATDYQYEQYAKSDAEMMEKLKEAGMEFTYPDKEAFEAASAQVYENYPEWTDLIKLIKETAAK